MDKESQSIAYHLIALLKKVIFGFIILILLIICGFILYLHTSPNDSVIEANGVYNLVDSEGNIIATDLTPEDIEIIIEVLNGKDKESN